MLTVDGFEMPEGFKELDLNDFGVVMAPVTSKIALIDADTLAWTSALAAQQEMQVLPDTFYTELELDAIKTNPTFDEESMTYSLIDIDMAMQLAHDKLQRIYELSGCRSCELHFSGGRENFRYMLFSDYKANRTGMKVPDGLYELKLKLCEKYNGVIHTKWEADDYVVFAMEQAPENYVLCAVDKDVINSVVGTHFNYYESGAFNKDMHYVTTEEGTAKLWPYIQCMTGDTSDGIAGVKGIGPKTALKFVNENMTHVELWEGVLSAYKSKDMDESQALLNMRLVNMHQLVNLGTEVGIKLWEPTNEL